MFKVGKIISLYKGEKKDKCDRTNCRDITLTFVVSKLLEKIVLSRKMNILHSGGSVGTMMPCQFVIFQKKQLVIM